MTAIIPADEVLADRARLTREMMKIYRKLSVPECMLIRDVLTALSNQRNEAQDQVRQLMEAIAQAGKEDGNHG